MGNKPQWILQRVLLMWRGLDAVDMPGNLDWLD